MNEELNTINHTMVLGPSGAGKTMRVVLPYILSIVKQEESFVVTDGKNKLLSKVYFKLKENKYDVVTINMREPEKSHAWNPLYLPYQCYLNNDMDTCIDLLDDLGKNIMMDRLPGESTDPFWATSSKNMFVGLAIALFEDPETTEDMINLRSIYYMSAKGFERFGGSTFIHQYFKDYPVENRALEYMSSILNAPNDTRGSILSVFYQKLLSFIPKTSFWNKLCENEIDVDHLCTSKTAIFLIYEDEKAESSTFINVFLRQIYEEYVRTANIEHNSDFVRCHFILDDFTSLMPFYNLPNMLMAARERNISFLFSINSMSLMEKIYGEELMDFVCNNCANWIIFKNSEVKFIKKLKEYIELFWGKEAFETCLQKGSFIEAGEALLVTHYKGVHYQILKIPEFLEEPYVKKNKSSKVSYSIYRIEEHVRQRMQDELIKKMGQDPASSTDDSYQDADKQIIESTIKKPNQLNFDTLIKRIDEKIAELEQEEKNKKSEEDSILEVEQSTQAEHIKTSSETADISLEHPVADIENIKSFGLYDTEQKKMIPMNTLFTFDKEETGEKYIVYTDDSKDEKGNVNVFASILKGHGKKVQLKPIEDEKIFDEIEVILSKLQQEGSKNINNDKKE